MPKNHSTSAVNHRPVAQAEGPVQAENGQAAGAARADGNHDFADFFENGAIAMHWVGPDGTILRANQCELDMLGYERAEYVGQHIGKFHVRQDVIGDILKRLSQREVLRNYGSQLRCKDGSVRDVAISSSVLWDGDTFVHTRCLTLDVTDQKKAEARNALLSNELGHRVRNSLAMVQAIASQTMRSASEEEMTAFSSRLRALANANTALIRDSWESTSLKAVIAGAIEPFCADCAGRVAIEGPDLAIAASKALALTLAMHELATNAAKYGALSDANGRLDIVWALEGECVKLSWTESGGPPVRAPERKGFGSHLLERALKSKLGQAQGAFHRNGVVWTLNIPV